MSVDLYMGMQVEKDSNGRLSLRKERKRNSRVNAKALGMGLMFAIAAVAATGITAAIAGGDNNMWNYGEDGLYEENNCNPYDDDDFPGEDEQNRTGVVVITVDSLI
ncbi:MAG TPA: hypothetical protein VMW71_06750 [Thermoplasmata archaeon]|nr:hypothetical protein [Thermoplasmata archaeon]